MSKIKFEFLEYGKSNKNIDFHVVEKSDNLVDQHVQYYVDQTTLSNNTTFSFPVVYSFVKTRDVYLLIRRELRTEQELGSRGSRPFEQRFIVVIPPEQKSFVVSLVNHIHHYVSPKLPYEVDSDNQPQFNVSSRYFDLFVAIMIELINGKKVQIPFAGQWKDAENIIHVIIAVLGFDRSLSIREPTFSYGLMSEVGDPNIIFTREGERVIAGRTLIVDDLVKKYKMLYPKEIDKYYYYNHYYIKYVYDIKKLKEDFEKYASLVKQYRLEQEKITRDLLELHFTTGNEKLWAVFEEKKSKQVNPELLQKLYKYAVDRLFEADAIPDLLEWVYLAQKESIYGNLFWKHPKLDEENLSLIGSSLLSDFLSNEEKSMDAIYIVQTRIIPGLEEPKEEHPNLKLVWTYKEGTQKELENILRWKKGSVSNVDVVLKNAVIENRPKEFLYLFENHKEDIAKLNLKGLLDSVFEEKKLKQVNPELLQKLCKYAVDRLLEADSMPEAHILLEWVYLAEKESTYGNLFWKDPKLDEEKLYLIGSSLLSDKEKSREAISIVQTRILPRLIAEPEEVHRNLKLAWKYNKGESNNPHKVQEELKNILCWDEGGVDVDVDVALKNAVAENRRNEFRYLLKILEIENILLTRTKIILLIRLTEGHAYFDEVMQSLLKHPTGLVKLIETLVDDKSISADTIENCFKFISTDEMDKVIKDISLKSNIRFIHLIKNALFKDKKPVIEYFLEHWEDTKDHNDISSSIDLLTLYFNKGDNTPLSEHSYVILRYITDNCSKIKVKAQMTRRPQVDQCIVSFLKHFNNKEDYSKFTEEDNYPITYYIINRHLGDEDRGKSKNGELSIIRDKIKSILDSFDTPEKKNKFTTYWKTTKENNKDIPWGKTLAERVPLYVKWILWVVGIVIILLILLLIFLLIVTSGKFLSSMMIR